jgi:hypothetical protein
MQEKIEKNNLTKDKKIAIKIMWTKLDKKIKWNKILRDEIEKIINLKKH